MGQRLFFENAHYHITDRGNDKAPIFADFDDRLQYLALLEKVKTDFLVQVAAYALMTNHIHLYLVTPKANLAEAMFDLNNAYSHYFNKRHNRTGHLFEGRYKCKLVQRDNYSLALARYIHLNPVKAGLSPKAEDYAWSSAAQYLGIRGGLADPAIVLAPLSEDREKALAKYVEFMAEPPETFTGKTWKIFDKNRNMIIGDREFKTAHTPHDHQQD